MEARLPGGRAGGRQKETSLGDYPAVSLAAARKKRDAARAAAPAGQTFKALAVMWLDRQIPNWVPKHADIVTRRLETEVFPVIGHMQIANVTGADVLGIIRTIEARGALHVSRKLRQTIAQIFDFAIAEDEVSVNPAVVIKAAVRPTPRSRSHAKVTDLVDFMRRLQSYDGEALTSLAIETVLRTTVRTSELRFAVVDEIAGGTDPDSRDSSK